MGGTSKSAPDTPDLNTTINAQTGGNIGMANLGTLYGTESIYGGTEWEKDRNDAGKVVKSTYTDPYTGKTYKVPEYKQVSTPSDTEQRKYDLSSEAQIAGLQGYNEILSSLGVSELDPTDVYTKSIGDYGGSVYDAAANPLTFDIGETEKRLTELGKTFLDPQYAQEQASAEARAAEQGIGIGSAAYNTLMQQQGDKKARAYNDLYLYGHGQSVAEQQAEWDAALAGQGQQFNQALGVWDEALKQRGQYSTEELAQQGLDLQTATLLGQAGGVQSPQLTSSTPAAPAVTDYAGLIQQDWKNLFDSWSQEMANKNSLGGGVLDLAGSLGGAAIMSDERIKDNIKQVGKTADGLPIYEFSIGDGEMQTGVMAQDVEAVDPSAVVRDPATGLKGVNYDQAVGDGTGTYTVEKGDSLWKIGERLGVDPQLIIEANPDIQNPDFIVPGQQLVVPGMAAPGPEAIPMSALPAAGAATGIPAVAAALAAPAGPGTMPPGGGMPAAAMPPAPAPVSPFAGKFIRPTPVPAPPRSPESIQSAIDQAIDQGLPIPPRQVIDQEAMRQLLMSGGMGGY